MRNLLRGLRDSFKRDTDYDVPVESSDYIAVSPEYGEGSKAKILVRPFVLEDFEDIKTVIDSLREGYTIALVNIRPLRDRDLIELKRAINKLKKTCDAIEGDIAGFGEDWIAVVPSFAQIHRDKAVTQETKEE